MAKIRLTQWMRQSLLEIADQSLVFPIETTALDHTYRVAAPLVRAAVEVALPPADAEVLMRYEHARRDSCIPCKDLDSDYFTVFNFHQDDTYPIQQRCRVVPISGETVTALKMHELAAADLKKARAERMNDYRALILTLRNLEDIEAVWPLAGQLRARLGEGRALTTLNNDVITRIRRDTFVAARPLAPEIPVELVEE